MFLSALLGLFLLSAPYVGASPIIPPDAQYYRDQLTMKIRPEGSFKVLRPDGSTYEYNYKLTFDTRLHPDFKQPRLLDTTLDASKGTFMRTFMDKVYLGHSSYIEVGGERINLTCLYIDGRDNRFDGDKSPLFPEYLLKVYLVANSFSCDGPLRKGWPATGGKKEMWDTYIYFEVRDPTIMLPTDIILRFLWNEYHSILVK